MVNDAANPMSNDGRRFWENRTSHRLANRILSLPHSETARVDFLRHVCSLLMRHTDSTAVELWVEENGACARSRAQQHEPGGFQFNLVPCHRRGGIAATELDDELLCELGGQAAPDGTNSEVAAPCSVGFSQSRPVPLTESQIVDPEIASAGSARSCAPMPS